MTVEMTPSITELRLLRLERDNARLRRLLFVVPLIALAPLLVAYVPPNDKVEAILSGLPTSFDDKREQLVYEMAICLSNARWVSKGLYDRAVEALGHVGITDVITLMGHYTSASMMLAFYDVPSGATGMAR